jgi:arylformamidase
VESPDPNRATLAVDDEYNPRLRVANVAEIFAQWKAKSEYAQTSLAHLADLRYGEAAAETLDLFPAAKAGAPLLVFVHGGYWRAFDKADFSWIAPAYVGAGAAVAVVNYGLAPATPIEAIVDQVARACAWLYRQALALDIDRERIVCAGHSAGAHLTATMLTIDWPRHYVGIPQPPLSGVVCFSGIHDLRPLVRAEFLKADLQLDDERAWKLSPAFKKPLSTTPCVLAVGGRESDEFRRQTRLLFDAWHSALPCETFELPAADHFSICDEFVTTGNRLFEATRALLDRAPLRR